MKRIRLVAAVAAMMATMAVSAVPAMADVRFVDDDGLEDRVENRVERIEDYYDHRGIDIDEDYLWWWYVVDAFDIYYD